MFVLFEVNQVGMLFTKQLARLDIHCHRRGLRRVRILQSTHCTCIIYRSIAIYIALFGECCICFIAPFFGDRLDKNRKYTHPAPQRVFRRKKDELQQAVENIKQ